MNDIYRVTSYVKDKDVYYTVAWTPLAKADRYKIATGLPALSGIMEIYWEDEKKKLHLMTLEHCWYGGVRGKIREKIDEDLETDPKRKKILEDRELYYRYVLTDSWKDIQDLMFFFIQRHRPGAPVTSSGRYEKIFVRENPLVL